MSSETLKTEPHTHCWHSPMLSISTGYNTQQREEVCCHCGARQWVPIPQPPIPDGHGPHYPRPFGAPIGIPFNQPLRIVGNDPTLYCKCRPENGGNGVCGCILSQPTMR